MARFLIPLLSAVALSATAAQAQVDGDPKRGAARYRACVACHSSDAGPARGSPVILFAGLIADRAWVFFAGPEEISAFITHEA